MDIQVTPSKIGGIVYAPPSKSYAHRYIIASYLSNGEGFIQNVQPSKDILATLSVLKNIGLCYFFENGGVKISRGTKINRPLLNCNESGSTLRFMLPILPAINIPCEFTGEKRLLERPIGDLINCLNENGANIDGFKINGRLSSGTYKIKGDISSQFITGLLFALPILNGDSNVEIQGSLVSEDYINITLDVLEKFGIIIKKTAKGYFVKGNQKYVMPQTMVVEGDYSNSAFLLSMGVLGDGVTVLNLNKNSKQGDSKIIEIIKKFGGNVKELDGGYFVSKGNLKGICIDCENTPDIVQIISVIASFSKGKTVLKNVSRLEIKESDRVQGIINNLKNGGIKAEYDGCDLTVYGGEVKGGIFSGDNDHRTVMSSAVLSAFASGTSIIKGVEAIQKSYPTFFEDYKLLGGKINGDI